MLEQATHSDLFLGSGQCVLVREREVVCKVDGGYSLEVGPGFSGGFWC